MKSLFDYADDDSWDVDFIKDTKFLGGRASMEEYLSCGMYPLSAASASRVELEIETTTTEVYSHVQR
jgi:hypothetical protein